MPSINVLQVYKTCYPYTHGGIEEVIHQLTIETVKLGVNNRIICLSAECKKKTVIKVEGATIICYPLQFEIASCGFSWAALKDFRQQTQWADIVQYHAPWPFADLMHVLCRIKTPSIITYHSDVIRQKVLMRFYEPLMKLFLQRAKIIVATSDNYLKSSKVLQQYKNKTCVIPLGIAAVKSEVFHENSEIITQLRSRWGDSFFLFVGVLRYYKGLNYLLESLKNTAYPVVIAGDGPELERLKAQAKQLKLNNVHFLGFVSEKEKHALFYLAKAVVFPSCERSEAYGITLVEAAMHQRAMISTELQTGTSYINIHQETGLVVAAKNTKELRVAMHAMDKNNEQTKRMGKNAYLRYQQLLTSKVMAKSYTELYLKLLAPKSNA